MSAPWQPPAANDPRAIGLKNGGLSDISTDIIYPASRLIKGDFQSGSQLEFRWRSDSARQFVPRESRLFVEYQIKLGETALTGSGTAKNRIVNAGAPAPTRIDASKSAAPNGNLAFSAAPNAQLFSQARLIMNSVTVENNPHYPTTAMAHLRTKTELGAAATTGSAMLNSLEKAQGDDPLQLCNHSKIDFYKMLKALPPIVRDQFNGHDGTQPKTGTVTQFYKTFQDCFDCDIPKDFQIFRVIHLDETSLGAAGETPEGCLVQQTGTDAVFVCLQYRAFTGHHSNPHRHKLWLIGPYVDSW